MWKYIISAWIDDTSGGVGGEGLEGIENLKAYPGRMDEYVDISIATAFNMMRASRIMLQGDIVRTSAYLCPTWQDYRITEEYNDAVRVSKGLIEDIIASIPYFLGRGEGSGDEGKGKGKRPERSFVGTSALGLFVTWPLMMVKMSDYSSERQRRWAEGRLRFIADELGIGQALMFSKASLPLAQSSPFFLQIFRLEWLIHVPRPMQGCLQCSLLEMNLLKFMEWRSRKRKLLN